MILKEARLLWRWLPGLGVLLAGASGVVGQAAGSDLAKVVSEWDAAQRRAEQVEFVRAKPGALITSLRWRQLEIVLKQPVQDCAVGGTQRGDLVALVGGVRESLDVYLVPRDGKYQRYATEGGRRMPRRFNTGTGSWPVVEGRHLVLLVFSRDGVPEFRALDFAARVQASRRLPPAVEGFTVRSDADAGVVEIRFGSAAPALSFRHPLAPRLELSRGLLQFGVVEQGSSSGQLLQLRNTGARALNLRIEPLPAGFAVRGEQWFVLEPGQRRRLQIEFTPRRVGEFDARMKILATGPVPEHLIVLRAVSRAVAAPPTRASPTPTRSGKSSPSAAREKLLPPVLVELRMHLGGGDRLLLLGRVAPAPGSAALDQARLEVAVQLPAGAGGVRREHLAVVDASGRFALRLRIAAGTELRLAAVGPDQRRSPSIALGKVPAPLRVTAGRAWIHCWPQQEFLLVAHSAGKVLRVWHGRADSSGKQDLALAVLGDTGNCELSLSVVTEVDGKLETSPAVVVDRAKR